MVLDVVGATKFEGVASIENTDWTDTELRTDQRKYLVLQLTIFNSINSYMILKYFALYFDFFNKIILLLHVFSVRCRRLQEQILRQGLTPENRYCVLKIIT